MYFVVKNHPFSDGNKRSGAFLSVDFISRNGRLFDAHGNTVINDTGLATLTLLVAESDPKQKDTLIRLIMHMLASTGDFSIWYSLMRTSHPDSPNRSAVVFWMLRLRAA